MPGPDPLVTEWTATNGKTYSVKTKKKSTESELNWQARHNAAVAYWQTYYPPA